MRIAIHTLTLCAHLYAPRRYLGAYAKRIGAKNPEWRAKLDYQLPLIKVRCGTLHACIVARVLFF